MQNKGAIRLFVIALALVSIYQLSFTWIARQVREDAKEYAGDDVKKELYYLDSIATKPVYNLLFTKYTYKDCQAREINLGLDLKGGMDVTLEVSVVDIIRSMSGYNTDATFNKAIARAKELQKDSQDDFVTLFGKAFAEIDANASLAAIFTTPELKDKISFNSTNAEVLDLIKEEAEAAIDNSFNILRSRIDRFGVAQPNIQRLETSGRILVSLPGIKEPERVRKLLQGTANLEFWETYESSEVLPFLQTANAKIREIEKAKEDLAIADAEAKADEPKVDEPKEGEDALLDKIEAEKADSTAIDQAQLMKDNPLFSRLQPLNRQGAAVGFAHYKDTAQINSYLKITQVRSLFPPDLKFLWSVKSIDKEEESLYELIAIKITTRDRRAPLDGGVITNARSEFAQGSAKSEVSMSMNSEGAKIWARLTGENVGKCIAIVLDNYVYSYPRVDAEITGGTSSITGGFTVEEAKDLANVLKSGKMPAPAVIIADTIVGPSLGQAAIEAGLKSFLIAFALVLIYMIFYYSRRGGIVADIALLVNMFFIIGVLSSFGATLTLPGIAGIVLTIGMSVDANVLIYERIREELAGGKGLKQAITDGYRNAYSAILDANITTFLTAVILFLFGSGPIKGFATTLMIGIATSLITAIFITRLIFEWQLKREQNITFGTKLTNNFFKNTNINFIGKRKVYYVISGIFIVLGIMFLFTKGLNPGIDFKGGRTYVVKFEQEVKTTEIAKMLADDFDGAPEVKTFGGKDQVRIITKYRIDESGTEVDDEVDMKLYEGLKPALGDNVSFDSFMLDYRQSSEKVGPTIADDIKKEALLAIFFALIIMFIYILIRFKNWQFGLGAVAALVHDTLIVLGLFSILDGIVPFSLEIDQAFIAAILTVVGYSINDTVVVFDRIREFIGLYPKRERRDIMNSALNSTLSRTFSTSLSTFVVLLAIFIFGGEVIRGFVFALLIGVVVGTYSSLFIATPLVYDTVLKGEKKRVLKGKGNKAR
ncbi:MAG: protein translocase subunit SecDF [Bacteroidales bacterium]|jgi:SecD/SecF fusion protein|nr:protein translocase subunit SecDF [Bacteroidales bacterium]